MRVKKKYEELFFDKYVEQDDLRQILFDNLLMISIDLLQKSLPFALSLSKGARRTCSSALRQAQSERNDGSKATYARGLMSRVMFGAAQFYSNPK